MFKFLKEASTELLIASKMSAKSLVTCAHDGHKNILHPIWTRYETWRKARVHRMWRDNVSYSPPSNWHVTMHAYMFVHQTWDRNVLYKSTYRNTGLSIKHDAGISSIVHPGCESDMKASARYFSHRNLIELPVYKRHVKTNANPSVFRAILWTREVSSLKVTHFYF